MITNCNEVLFKKSFNISHNLEKLIDGFYFDVDPADGIKNVKIKDITIVSPCESYDLSLVINEDKELLLNTIKSKNISASCVAIKEIGLDITFHKGFCNEKDPKKSVRINYFSKTNSACENTLIKKYLKRWGLLNAKSIQ